MKEYQITLSHTKLETLRFALVTAWHDIRQPNTAAQVASILDEIETQAGVRRTRLGEPNAD